MSTVVVRRNNGQRVARNPNRRRRQKPTSQVVVYPMGRQPRNRRRRPRRVRRGGRNPNGGRSGVGIAYEFNKDNLKDSSSGTITFGPSLSEKDEFAKGTLLSFHEYKITSLTLKYISEAASTASGSIAYELDPFCKLDKLKSTLNKFPITGGGSRTFKAAEIRGNNWRATEEDQFKLHYKGNGTTNAVAGYFNIKFTAQFLGTK